MVACLPVAAVVEGKWKGKGRDGKAAKGMAAERERSLSENFPQKKLAPKRGITLSGIWDAVAYFFVIETNIFRVDKNVNKLCQGKVQTYKLD